jgi:hypothetical protein
VKKTSEVLDVKVGKKPCHMPITISKTCSEPIQWLLVTLSVVGGGQQLV